MYFQITLSLLFIFSTLHSCSSMRSSNLNEQKVGHYRLHSHPQKLKKDKNKDLKKIVFVSSNDFRGEISAKHFNIPNQNKVMKSISIGGISGMKAYAQIFRLNFPAQTLFLDAGSFYRPEKNRALINRFYNYVDFDVLGLGDQEFNLRDKTHNYLEHLGHSLAGMKTQVITSNLFNLTKATEASIKNVDSTIIKNISGLQVGIISVLSPKTPMRSSQNNFTGLYLQNNTRTIINRAKKLKRSGAQVVVLLTNLNIDCVTQTAKLKEINTAKVNFKVDSDSTCNKDQSDLYQVLKKLPKNTLDIVFTSGGNTKVANLIHDVPVLQNKGRGQFFSWAELYYNEKEKKLVKTIIHQPVQLCHQFLKDSEDCYLQEEIMNKKIIPATFLGSKVIISPLPTI